MQVRHFTIVKCETLCLSLEYASWLTNLGYLPSWWLKVYKKKLNRSMTLHFLESLSSTVFLPGTLVKLNQL